MDIEYYADFIPSTLIDALVADGESVESIPGLTISAGLRSSFPNIETDEALRFVVDLYAAVREDLDEVLKQRAIDRAFVDQKTASYQEANQSVPFGSNEYKTVVGEKDDLGRIVVGPLPQNADSPQVNVPTFLQGEQVTLFGPPDSQKLSINAMNALHRIPNQEPAVVSELVNRGGQVARWGADNEDSKTPIMKNFLHACENLMGCFDGTLSLDDGKKQYAIEQEQRSLPIKRIPGLALPDGNHIYNGSPLPLHLYDFAMHLFHNWRNPQALIFYIPKLENEEEAAYVSLMVEKAEQLLSERFSKYQSGNIGLFIVFENPRAIFRIREIADTLHPYFIGGSLGWHDFLGSTARLFKNDPRYRIPVKADPNIVINHIRESHEILVDALKPIGGITIGGMYGVLYENGNSASYEVSMVGYIKDVITQLKRGLDGFWVAHPDFVRPGLALVQAYREFEAGSFEELERLVKALVPNASEHEPLLRFLQGEDVPGLKNNAPGYARSVLAADIETSDVIANDDPEEVRYNVFQALQYLADWLSGNGCVALPATLRNVEGEKVFVRIMDDLATTERSRWELWAEVYHQRVGVELFEKIVAEEMAFIRAGEDSAHKRVQVRYEGQGEKWYPIAEQILKRLVLTDSPPEFATELLMPFTFDEVRDADDPWAEVQRLCPRKYA